ncbi:hypothetical protein KGF45_16070 [Clostridioides sp. ZZV14-6154]|uniref:hypothetical protein n=1 Tax=Clostridioides sp. ZZV14-6154 TaxID=2811495 RepID=UPI001D1303AF|nr:hypothetical protein [Clostridioides sp. ZZV14-6154]
MKKYIYDSKRYIVSVTIPGIFMILILIYALFNNYINLSINIYSLMIVICTYGVFNTFVSSSNPKMITMDNKYICFSSFNITHKYEIKDIKKIRIREFHGKKMYLKINDGSFLKGRYWIKTNMFNGNIELYNYFIELEECLHPESLKFRSKSLKSNEL